MINLSNCKVNLLNFIYIVRMLKDKTYQSVINWYYKEHYNVERIYNEPETIYNHLKKLSTKMTPIIDNIYLGNACDASFYYKLKNANIGLIVNVTKEIPNYFEEEFDYYNIKIYDINTEYFKIETLQNTIDFLQEYKTNNPDKNILIHCYMGSSRSATIVLAYLIIIHKYSLETALEFIKNKRKIVNINTSFIKNLEKL